MRASAYRRIIAGQIGTLFVLFIAAMTLWQGTLRANPVTFFGEDLNGFSAHPNADAARLSFLSNLAIFGTENFEAFSPGAQAPLAMTFGPTTGTGTGIVGQIVQGPDGAGRFPVSGTQFWCTQVGLSSGSLTIDFNSAQRAIGFYGTDMGDGFGSPPFAPPASVTLTYAAGGTTTLTMPHTLGAAADGAVAYFGVITDPFVRAVLNATNDDTYGFDDITVGLPEPAGVSLLALGVLALRRRGR